MRMRTRTRTRIWGKLYYPNPVNGGLIDSPFVKCCVQNVVMNHYKILPRGVRIKDLYVIIKLKCIKKYACFYIYNNNSLFHSHVVATLHGITIKYMYIIIYITDTNVHFI